MAKAVLVGFRLLLRAMIFFAFYLLLADTLHQDELTAGGVIAVCAAIVSTFLAGSRQAVRVRPRMLRHLPRSLLLLFTDTGRVTWALVRSLVLRQPLRGHVRAVRYQATSEADPEDFGRRALTQWGASLGANRYVLGIDNERQVLLVHELVDSSGPLDPLELG
jgi:multisubunit Na+/H+ antiporter MnhE subunit